MLGLSPLYALAAVLVAAWVGRLLHVAPIAQDAPGLPGVPESSVARAFAGRLAHAMQRAVDHRWMPAAVGLLSGAATWYAWGSLARSAVVHDEAAYLLQAQLFAALRWAGEARPLPQFFEQLYVLVEPVLASKYPPGTSLLIAPGAMLGLPGLPVVIANGFTGALVFSLARRLSDGHTALVAWLLWISSFPSLYFRAMYLSEVPSGLAVLAAWWSFVRWRDEGRPLHLTAGAAAVAFCAITRPLTGVALALATGTAVLWTLREPAPRAGRRLATVAGIAAGTAALTVAFLMLWSWRTTGDPRVAPITQYTRTYVPFDRLGFGARAEDRPTSRQPWDQQVTSRSFYEEHRRHTLRRLPTVVVERVTAIARDMWYEWRGGLAVFALLGLFVASRAVWIGVAGFATQLLLYLLYAHPPRWSVYYLEWLPLLALVTAAGVTWTIDRLGRGAGRQSGRALPVALLVVALLHPAWRTARLVRAQIAQDHGYYDSFVRALPRRAPGTIVFVRYAPNHNDGVSLVRNVPDPASAPVWTVYDRGAENDRLRALAPERTAYLFDEATWTLRPLAPAAAPAAAPVAPPVAAPVAARTVDCRLSRDDSAWTSAALTGWNRQRTRGLRTPPPAYPQLVLFDTLCTHSLTTAGAERGVPPPAQRLEAAAQSFDVRSAAHAGHIRLPTGDSVPAGLVSFAGPLPDGRLFFVMSMPAVWRRSARGPNREKLATAVFMHEFTHTQSAALSARVDELVRRGLPEESTDDVVQDRFADAPGFAHAYDAELALLFEAARAPNVAATRAIARRALRLMDRRRGRHFHGANAIYGEAEDLFLTMEGTGQWAAYLWLLDPAGGAMRPDVALPFIRRGGRKWSQDEGLALLLVLSRLDPRAPERLFGPAPATLRSLLRELVGESR